MIDRDTLRRRLLLCLFALGTNMGIKAIVATASTANHYGRFRLDMNTRLDVTAP